LIGRWKMLDNLRRTLSAPAAFLILVAGWALTTGSPGVWTAFVLATIALPTFLSALGGLIPRNHDISKRSHTRAVARDLLMAASQTAFAITMLAHQAWLMSDAIVRTLARVYVTRRNLLEWVTAAQAKSGLRSDLRGFYARMGGAVTLAAVAAALVAWARPAAWPVALPFLLLWTLSTVAAHDFGWIGTIDALERLEATFVAMRALERFRGHFYNWYGTEDGRALDPRYVSSVDSGNLAGHLIALAQGCREMLARPLPD